MPENAPTPQDLTRDLAADLALCAEATPGPWRAVRDHNGHWRILWPRSDRSSVMRGDKLFDDADAALVAAAREGWPAALRRALSAEAELATLRARVHDFLAALTPLLAPKGGPRG